MRKTIYESRPEVETLQRTRRIETRLTQLMIAMGVHTDAQRPIFNAGALILPSAHCSMKEIVDSIPPDWHGPVGVFVGTDKVATIRR
jgi:hypothetical protein